MAEPAARKASVKYPSEESRACAACHEAATPGIIDAADIAAGQIVTCWQKRREDMKKVCASCHAPGWVDNWHEQFGQQVSLYNDKFGLPATKLYQMTRAAGLITNDVDCDDQLEFTYSLLWHHEGRRARMGAAMMGPDYTQWHGNFEVAQRFYIEFVPQLKDVLLKAMQSGDEAKVKAAQKVQAELDTVLNSKNHRWFLGKMAQEERDARKKGAEEFRNA